MAAAGRTRAAKNSNAGRPGEHNSGMKILTSRPMAPPTGPERHSRSAAGFRRIVRGAVRLALAGMAMLAAAIPATAAVGPDVAHFTLANGLEVVVIPDHRVAVVTHMIWYKVGAADEQPGRSGLAHFLEHLMFKGTAKNPGQHFSEVVAWAGGQENAFTSNDYTGYYQRVPRGDLAKVMGFEADRMTGLVLTDAVVRPELQVVLEEQNQRIANNPSARLGIEVAAALYRNHPYGKPVIGWRHEIEKLTRKEALDFYRRHYAPNNAVVIVAGDVTADEVRKLAEATYGQVPPRTDLAPRVRPQEPPQEGPRTVTLADARVAQPSLRRSYLVPSYTTAKHGEAVVLDVLTHILGGGASSRLYRTLVVDNSLAVNARAWYQGSALDDTRLGVYATPRPGVSLARLEAAMDAVIAKLADKGVTADELERAKTRLVADAIYAQDRPTTLARWYGVAITTGSTVEAVRTWPDRIGKVTAEQVRDAARRWLDIRRSVTGYLVKSLQGSKDKSQ
jgi:zinc protease